MGRSGGPAPDQFTPRAVERRLGQLEARAAKASDETLTSAVITGRRALAERQDLADRLRDLEGEHERLAQCESRALARLQYVLDLPDKFAEPAGPVSATVRSDYQKTGGRIPAPPGRGAETSGVLAVRMLGPLNSGSTASASRSGAGSGPNRSCSS
jgi:hypothetical protein